jgi:hypothetical protein
MSKRKIEETLTRRLKLKTPRFFLRKDGVHILAQLYPFRSGGAGT